MELRVVRNGFARNNSYVTLLLILWVGGGRRGFLEMGPRNQPPVRHLEPAMNDDAPAISVAAQQHN